MEIASKTGNSRFSKDDFIRMGVTRAVVPSTKPIFAIFEPIAFPVASPVLPCMEAIPATNISGAEVPNPIIVRPIIKGDIPKFRAMADVPLTKKSAENIKKKKPARRAAENRSIEIKMNRVC